MPRPGSKVVLRVTIAVAMTIVGVLHFLTPEPFVRIVPAFLPAPLVLVHVSGVFEILGGIGILVPRTRRLASYGLVALYLAVFPANINMAVNDVAFDGVHHLPALALWGRLPLQALFIYWALKAGRDKPPHRDP